MINIIKLAPSILSADFSCLGDQLRQIEEAGADLIHVDVMDGHFVPNITIGPLVVEAVKKSTKLPLDVHLMISEPQRYIDAFAKAGADMLTFHYEASPHSHRLLQQIKKLGLKAGLAINPGTPINYLEAILDDADLITIMSVNPGFGGQTFIPSALDKVTSLKQILKKRGLDTDIEVDGGITLDNVASAIKAGAKIIVAGSAVFGTGQIKEEVSRFLDILNLL